MKTYQRILNLLDKYGTDEDIDQTIKAILKE
jgi:hypothetical protein